MGLMASGLDRLSKKVSRRRKDVTIGACMSGRSSKGGQKRRCQSLSPDASSKRRLVASAPAAAAHASPQTAERPYPNPLASLAAGPYLGIASYLDAHDLSHTDAACRQLRAVNKLTTGPWHSLGECTYRGMELEVVGGFQSFGQDHAGNSENWKARWNFFRQTIPSFSSPFAGREILRVANSDIVAYCRCRLRTDILALHPDKGIYVEVDISANADNLSLAVVDFDGGGQSSVTFSPETGAVLRECRVRDSSVEIEGTYIHLLPSAGTGHRFQGTLGLYLKGGHLAFFRRWRGIVAGNRVQGAWECTGFCTDLKWAQGKRLSVCLAFRDSGAYRVSISKIGSEVPFSPKPSAEAYEESKWSRLYHDDDHALVV
eukprot:TRINITY_DN41737_c0_g1_i1.p1 TRINITY_DN41737_c0_g1~~TRINITY_DN41737_c0_g1_i1.p1  ORF type:complete len:407 (-),score=53.88 TRINITY_DN41737_c0_g1_i1:193-1311(-)